MRLPTTVYAKIRYQEHIWYDESENHPLDEERQRVRQYLATNVYVMKLIKLYWLLDLSPMNPIDSLYIHLEQNNNV